MFSFKLLGQARLTFGSQQLPIDLKPQSTALLACLALQRKRECAFDELIEQIWPECDPVRGRSRLSSALWRLRKALGSEGRDLLEVSAHGEVRLSNTLPIWLDFLDFENDMMVVLSGNKLELDQGIASKLERGLGIYQGELMPGWYCDWIVAERERLHGLYVAGLHRLMEHHAKRDALDLAIATGRKILMCDSLRETAHRRLIELYIANGQPLAAQRQYQDCSRLLREELGVAPSLETQASYTKLSGS